MAEKSWETLEGAVHSCKKCRLWEMRTNVVIGRGNPESDIMFIGEGPGQQEDLTGKAFVGAAGKLLDKMLESVGLSEESVYIANIVKCRPPGNRDPLEDEKEACMNYLRYQLGLVKPKIIVCLGRIAATSIISPDFKITKQRGQWIERKGYYIMATYHPSALLRDESKKRPAWEDFKAIKAKYMELKERGELNER
ncbi:MAG: uracil-DNA glycosylase [Lachnospiraceae bacterium]|nr:uracil-DNA glycosylase [Lachnospiraceae bacterium]